MSRLSSTSKKDPSLSEEESLLFRLSKKVAYMQHMVYRQLPNILTNRFHPFLMTLPYLRRAHSNTANIPVNLTSQAICAKHCGNCPSNPFTQGGLYCISGKSKNLVKEKGCHCFECELFEQCGGLGYFCKYGSADQMRDDPILGEDLSTRLNKIAQPPKNNNLVDQSLIQKETNLSRSSLSEASLEDVYHQRFIDGLIHKKEEELSKYSPKAREARKSPNQQKVITVTYEDIRKKVTVPYGKSLLEISLANNIPHTHVCGGRAKCSTCRVLVIDGTNNLSKRNAAEEVIALRKHFPPRVRLACQSIPQGDITIRTLIQDKKSAELAISQKKDEANFFAVDCHAAVLFADIRAFTTFSEANLVYDIVQMLNEYFSAITKPIDRYGGYVDKYMGDGIMAIFGLEKHPVSPEEAALCAALDIIKEVQRFNVSLKNRYEHEFRVGVGIDAGEIVMAKLGFDKKNQFTAIGDIVNTSSRIETETKLHNANILVSHNVYKVVNTKFHWGKKFSSQLRGKKHVTNIYEPVERKNKS